MSTSTDTHWSVWESVCVCTCLGLSQLHTQTNVPSCSQLLHISHTDCWLYHLCYLDVKSCCLCFAVCFVLVVQLWLWSALPLLQWSGFAAGKPSSRRLVCVVVSSSESSVRTTHHALIIPLLNHQFLQWSEGRLVKVKNSVTSLQLVSSCTAAHRLTHNSRNVVV